MPNLVSLLSKTLAFKIFQSSSLVFNHSTNNNFMREPMDTARICCILCMVCPLGLGLGNLWSPLQHQTDQRFNHRGAAARSTGFQRAWGLCRALLLGGLEIWRCRPAKE